MPVDGPPGEDGGVARAAALAALGLAPGTDAAKVDASTEPGLADPDPRVRAAALGARVRAGSSPAARDSWQRAVADESPAVRRRAAELAPDLAPAGDAKHLVPPLVTLLDDATATVVEAAAWALGELGPDAVAAGATPALARIATTHDDPLAREAAVAALGALADPAGLDAVLTACTDKPAVRRRAVLALAPFDDPRVDAALHAALEDRDWQVRQAAEDLLAAAD